MQANNIQIKCEQWQIVSTGDDNEINFFGSTAKFKLNEIDLMEYCISDEFPISNKGEDIDLNDDNSSLDLFRNYGAITLKLSNIKSFELANGFFHLFDEDYQSATAKYIRYKVTVIVNDKPKFLGVLTPIDIKHNCPKEINAREVIEIPAYSWDKEFETYFKGRKMPDLSTINIIGNPFPSHFNGLWRTSWNSTAFDNASIYDILRFAYNIDGSTLRYGGGIDNTKSFNNWRIARLPSFVNIPTDTYTGLVAWFGNGYDYVKDNMDYSMFDFLKYMSNSMGWQFYYEYYNDELRFTIKNRVASEESYTNIQIDYDKLTEHFISFTQYTNPVSIIKISIVELTSGGSVFDPLAFSGDIKVTNGARDRLFISNDYNVAQPTSELIYFDKMKINTSGTIHNEIDFENNYKFNRYSDLNNNKQHFIEYRGFNILTTRSFQNANDFYFELSDLLHIKAGDNFFNVKKKKRRTLSTNTESDFFVGESEVGDNELIFIGNIGTAMFYGTDILTSSGIEPYLTINNGYITPYYQSEQFNANMNALLSQNTNLIIEFEVTGIYDSPNSLISFTNIPNDAFNGLFEIIELTCDYIKEISTFKVRKR